MQHVLQLFTCEISSVNSNVLWSSMLWAESGEYVYLYICILYYCFFLLRWTYTLSGDSSNSTCAGSLWSPCQPWFHRLLKRLDFSFVPINEQCKLIISMLKQWHNFLGLHTPDKELTWWSDIGCGRRSFLCFLILLGAGSPRKIEK